MIMIQNMDMRNSAHTPKPKSTMCVTCLSRLESRCVTVVLIRFICVTFPSHNRDFRAMIANDFWLMRDCFLFSTSKDFDFFFTIDSVKRACISFREGTFRESATLFCCECELLSSISFFHGRSIFPALPPFIIHNGYTFREECQLNVCVPF